MTDEPLHHYEVEIRSADSKGGVGVTHIEYKTRLPSADDVPHEIAAELEKSLGKDHVTGVDADR